MEAMDWHKMFFLAENFFQCPDVSYNLTADQIHLLLWSFKITHHATKHVSFKDSYLVAIDKFLKSTTTTVCSKEVKIKINCIKCFFFFSEPQCFYYSMVHSAIFGG